MKNTYTVIYLTPIGAVRKEVVICTLEELKEHIRHIDAVYVFEGEPKEV
jgi:hypothetical protein